MSLKTAVLRVFLCIFGLLVTTVLVSWLGFRSNTLSFAILIFFSVMAGMTVRSYLDDRKSNAA